MVGIIIELPPKRGYDACGKIIFGSEKSSLIPYVISEDNAYRSNRLITTPEHPGLIELKCRVLRRFAPSIVPKLRTTAGLPKNGRAASLPLHPAD